MTDKIEEIRARHLRDDRWRNTQSNEDRATLLAEVDRLRADLATQQNCCDGAAAQDAHVRREREEHRAEVERLRAEIERLGASILSLAKSLRASLDAAIRQRDEARVENERLRAALQESACACSSMRECASEWAKDGKCPHLIARVALEGKP